MSQLNVPFVLFDMASVSLDVVAYGLKKGEKNFLDFVPWQGYAYKPEVHFYIAHCTRNLYLQFGVQERYVAARYSDSNSPVFEDSCVEFFISFADDAAYYNLEFNCIGTALVGYGEGKANRTLLPKVVVEKIRYQVLHKNGSKGGDRKWELTVVIPFDVFAFHVFTSLRGIKGKANFYKCGDKLAQPHFLSWSNIKSDTPDFHLPRFFGTVNFL